MQAALLGKLRLIANSNEEGCNQYKPCSGGKFVQVVTGVAKDIQGRSIKSLSKSANSSSTRADTITRKVMSLKQPTSKAIERAINSHVDAGTRHRVLKSQYPVGSAQHSYHASKETYHDQEIANLENLV